MPVRRPNRSFSDLPTDLSGHEALRAGDAGHEAVAERAEESLRSRQERALVGRLPEPRPRRLRDVHAAFGLRPLPGQPARIDLVERIVAHVAEKVRITPLEAAGVLADEPPRARLIPPRPVVGEPAGLLKRPPRISKLHPHPARRRRHVQRPGRLPHHPSKTVVLPVLDQFPAVGGVPGDDVAHGVLVVGERPGGARGARAGRRARRAAPREPVHGTTQPTESARDAKESPPGRAPTASSNCRRLRFYPRLADLVPLPRKHRHRDRGVFAPNHRLRRAVTAVATRECRHAALHESLISRAMVAEVPLTGLSCVKPEVFSRGKPSGGRFPWPAQRGVAASS